MNDQEKYDYLSSHLQYEVSMMRATYERFDKPAGDDVDSIVYRNAVIESFAVHARGLYELLTNAKDNRNVVANDLVGSFEAARNHPRRVEVRKKLDSLNSQMMHLGKTRPDVIPAKQFNGEVAHFVLNWIEGRLSELDELIQEKLDVEWLPPKPEFASGNKAAATNAIGTIGPTSTADITGVEPNPESSQ